MKSEAWIFGICTIFFVLVSPAYWFITGDWTGTSALVMTTLLSGMVTLYLGFHAKKMEPRPEDRKDGEIADGAGELGFFPPYSWWPLFCSLAFSAIVLGLVIVPGHDPWKGGVKGNLAGKGPGDGIPERRQRRAPALQ